MNMPSAAGSIGLCILHSHMQMYPGKSAGQREKHDIGGF